jgi:hypothetical protein
MFLSPLKCPGLPNDLGKRFSEFKVTDQARSGLHFVGCMAPEIPRPAGKNAGLRDDVFSEFRAAEMTDPATD